MIAGTLAFLDEPVDEPIQSRYDRGVRGIDVDVSISYLDGRSVQTGVVAGRVTEQQEDILIGDDSIDINTKKSETMAAAEWVADVQDDGWILADRTHTTDDEHLPDWPFSQFQQALGVEMRPMGIDVQEFVKNQREAGRDFSAEMATQKGSESENVEINWGHKKVSNDDALQSNVGCALTVNWEGTFQRLVVYESGYAAIWSAEDISAKVARFVTEEIVPVAIPMHEVEQDSDDEDAVQTEVSG